MPTNPEHASVICRHIYQDPQLKSLYFDLLD